LKFFLKDLLNVPNTMSLFRVFMAPIMFIFWLGLDWCVAGLALGTAIGLTDALDGWVARKLNQTTELGGIIDQLGDLVFESTGLLIALLVGGLWSGILIIYLTREFTVMVVRAYVLSKGGSLPSSTLGKAKSSCIQWAFFFFFLGVILMKDGVLPQSWSMVGISPGLVLLWIGKASIILGITLGIITAISYLKVFVNVYVEEAQN